MSELPADVLPPGLSGQQAEQLMAQANDWHLGLSALAPTALRFSASVVDVTYHSPDGPAPTKVVQLRCYLPTGVSVMHLPVEVCDGLVELLEQSNALARTGLIVSQAMPV